MGDPQLEMERILRGLHWLEKVWREMETNGTDLHTDVRILNLSCGGRGCRATMTQGRAEWTLELWKS